MKRYNVMLDPETVSGMTALGDGNMSGGIRKAWELLRRRPKKKDPEA